MEETLENSAIKTQVETFEIEVKKIGDELPYWSRFITEKILTGQVITQDEINTSYDYLLKDLSLRPHATGLNISITYNQANTDTTVQLNKKSKLLKPNG